MLHSGFHAEYWRIVTAGIREGAELITGGLGRPEGIHRGYYVRPTIFANVTPTMAIAREEIFGPVLSIFKYETEEEAIRLANDSVYGLAAYVQSADVGKARKVAARLRAGIVHLNDPAPDLRAPFGGYKQSGNGKECGELAFAANMRRQSRGHAPLFIEPEEDTKRETAFSYLPRR